MEDSNIDPADPNTIPKFVDKLVKPPVARSKSHADYTDGTYYELTMKKAKHRFHSNFPLTEIWGYNGLIPGPTIEAVKD